MTTSLFQSINDNIDLAPVAFIEAINSIAPELFTPLLEIEGITEDQVKAMILYISFAYSEESSVIVLGSPYTAQKKRLFEKFQLKDVFYNGIVMLKDEKFRAVIIEYLNHQQDRDFKHLRQKMEVYEALVNSQLSDMHDQDGKVDYKSIVEVSKLMDKHLEDIMKLEETLKKKYTFIKVNFDEIEKVAPGQIASLAIEDNIYVK